MDFQQAHGDEVVDAGIAAGPAMASAPSKQRASVFAGPTRTGWPAMLALVLALICICGASVAALQTANQEWRFAVQIGAALAMLGLGWVLQERRHASRHQEVRARLAELRGAVAQMSGKMRRLEDFDQRDLEVIADHYIRLAARAHEEGELKAAGSRPAAAEDASVRTARDAWLEGDSNRD